MLFKKENWKFNFFQLAGQKTQVLKTETMKLNFEKKKKKTCLHRVHLQLSPEGWDETERS